MKIELPVDLEKCNGCGKCFIVCPDSLFVYNVDTKSLFSAKDREFNEFEDRLGGALLNLIKEQIHSDGVVSEDEKALLRMITRSFSAFKNMLHVAEPMLHSAKKYLFKKIWEEAIRDDFISQDEHQILEIVVNKLKISPDEKEIFIKEVEAEAQCAKELRLKLMK
jgi:ferredoxin